MERGVVVEVAVVELGSVEQDCVLRLSGLANASARKDEAGAWLFAGFDDGQPPLPVATQRFAAEAAFLDACCASPGLSVALVSTSTEQEEQTVLARGVLHGLEEIFETGAVDRACSLTFLDVPAEEDEGSFPRPPLELQLQIAAYEAATYEPPTPQEGETEAAAEEQEAGAHQKINTNKLYLPPPEDLEDWCKLVVTVDGVYNLPTSLLPSSALSSSEEAQQEEDGEAAGTTGRFLEDHAYSYELRLFDACFSGGKIWKPNAGGREARPASASPAASGEERPGTAESGKEPKPPVSIGCREFASALRRAGFAGGSVDGVFRGCFGEEQTSVTAADWQQLVENQSGEKPDLLAFYQTWVLENFASAAEAFASFGAEEVSSDAFVANVTELGFSEDAAPGVFKALSNSTSANGNGEVVTVSGFLALNLLPTVVRKTASCVSSLQKWMARNFGNGHELFFALQLSSDSGDRAEVTFDVWTERIAALGFVDAEAAGKAFHFLDAKRTGALSLAELDRLERFEGIDLESLRDKLPQKLPAAEMGLDEFINICYKSGVATKDAFAVFSLLDLDTKTGVLTSGAYSSVFAVPAVSDLEKLVAFLDGKQMSFEEMITPPRNPIAEQEAAGLSPSASSLPFVTWDTALTSTSASPSPATVTGYRGRAWIQQLQNLTSNPIALKSLHFFPKPVADPVPLPADFESSSDAAAAKPARWHHAVGEFDLNNFASSAEGASSPTTRETVFLVPLARVSGDCVPSDCTKPSEDVVGDPFFHAGTYVKFSVRTVGAGSVDPLAPGNNGAEFELREEAESRSGVGSVDPASRSASPTASRIHTGDSKRTGQQQEVACLLPPRSAEGGSRSSTSSKCLLLPFEGVLSPRLPPTAAEAFAAELFAFDPRPKVVVPKSEDEFHDAVVEALAVLGRDYCKFASETDRLDRNGLLGPMGWRDLLEKIEAGEEAGDGTPLLKILRPALQKLVRSRVVAYGRDRLPCSGLYGDERDAKYTDMSRELCALIFRTINAEHAKYGWRRNTSLWKNPPSCYEKEPFYEPELLAKNEQIKDENYKALARDAEMVGEKIRAQKFWSLRVGLELNKTEKAVWLDYARFCMRCLRDREEALRAVTHAISIGRTLEAVEAETLLFLSCLHLIGRNYDAAEFFAARCLQRSPASFAGNFFMFLVYAYSGSEKKARKFWALALKTKTFFTQKLPSMEFSLTELLKRENVSRGIVESYPEDAGRNPQDHTAELNSSEAANPLQFESRFSPFPSYTTVRALPDNKDKRVLDIVDVLLRLGLAELVLFLLDHMPGNPEEADTVQNLVLSKKTRSSERCRLQIVKAYMLQQNFSKAKKAVKHLLEFVTDRNSEAWVLLGECEFRLGGSANLSSAKEAFEKSQTFVQAANTSKDAVLCLRMGKILFEGEEYQKAGDWFLKSGKITPTSEAWRMAGICLFENSEDKTVETALACFREANLLDGTRPEIWAWAGMASMRGEKPALAKQGINFAALPDAITGEVVEPSTAAKLVELGLEYGKDYVEECGFLCRKVLERGLPEVLEDAGDGTAVGAAGEEETNVLRSLLAPEEEGRFHFLLGKTYEQAENWLGAFFEYRMAVPFFQTDGEMLDAIERHGRRVASEIKDTHKIISVLLQDLEVVRERGAGTFHKAPDGSQPAVDVN
mmetsp:Transcript_26240/g.66098  ORF Transcript_26240/g.66098 Transcript_26240/m.66098 type:complete len:1661 (-) Transcript_26240:362-5344(-)